MRIIRTVMPANPPKDFNEWSMYFFGMYATEMAKVKQGWEKNIYKPKTK